MLKKLFCLCLWLGILSGTAHAHWVAVPHSPAQARPVPTAVYSCGLE